MTNTLDGQPQPLDPKIRKQLKKQAKDLKDAQAKLAKQDREIAFAKAGIPDDQKGEALMRVYDGDLEKTKIRATYEELFGELGVEDDDLGTQQRIANAGKGGGTPNATGEVEFADALRAARGDNKKVLELLANAPPGAVGRIAGWEGRVAPPEIH